MKYIIYLRVSTDKQDVRTQEQECLRYIKSKENGKPFEHVIFSDPDVSSRIKMSKREGLMAMLNSLRKGQQVVVYKLDRLSRDVIEMVTIYRMIKDRKCGIHSLNDSNCDDEFTIGLMGVLAQKERSDISMRIKSKLSAKKERSELISRHTPYGFELSEDGIHLKPQSQEQMALAHMSEWFDEGKSFRSIAKELTLSGYMNREGRPFQHMSIYRIRSRTGRTRSSDQFLEDSEVPLSRSIG
jgi:DNA invertase Pin-like site-specific DNA recombinase